MLKQAIAGRVRRMVGSRRGELDLAGPGNPGLFGPDAVARRVHGDVTTMMAGGVAALLLQMLHPKALAGVWDHSNFRHDMAGRLRRTAQFVAGTTYGSIAQAEAMIARVRAIHDRVHGTLPDGTPYSANDPELLALVHVAGAACFVAAYTRYRASLSIEEQDRYWAETAAVARALGADPVPLTRTEAEALIARMRPELCADERTRIVARALFASPMPSPALIPFRTLVMHAGRDLLPDWAREMHGIEVHALERPALRIGMRGVGEAVRWALH